jgi:hypothetical protein
VASSLARGWDGYQQPLTGSVKWECVRDRSLKKWVMRIVPSQFNLDWRGDHFEHIGKYLSLWPQN